MTANTAVRNANLQDLVTLLKDQHARKLDVVVPATAVTSHNARLHVSGTEAVIDDHGVTKADGVYRPTEVADEGLAYRLGIPIGYLRNLRNSRPDLYDANVNGWLHGYEPTEHFDSASSPIPADPNPKSFLLRAFRGDDGGEGVARAFLSDRYGIIDNLDVLTAALSGIRDAGVEVNIDRCDLSDRKMYVRVTAPQVQAMAPDLLAGYRSPFTGQSGDQLPVVFAGFVISNSEVGGGAYTITPQVVVQVCSNGMTVKKDALRSVHLGSKQEEGVIRWSQDTLQKGLDLVTARTRDAVSTFLDTEYVEKVVADVTEQAGRPLPNAADNVQDVTKQLQFSDAETSGVLDHFIKGGQTTAGGVMAAVTSYAQTINDADRAYQVEEAGMRALELAASVK